MQIIKALLAGAVVMTTAPAFAHGSGTIVTGQVVNRPAEAPAVMTWNLCDPIVDDRMGMRLADDGTFRFETDGITRFHNATLNYGEFINFFVAPGDSIHLTIDAARLRDGAYDAVRFGGSYAQANSQLYTILNYLYSRLFSYPEPLDVNATPEAVIAQMKERMAQASDSLDAYTRSKGICLLPAVQDFVQRDMIFTLANQLLDYREDDPAGRLALFGDSFFGIHDTLNLSTMMFPYHLRAYMRTKVSADPGVIEAGKRGDFVTAARGGIRLLSEEPATASRDAMLWGYLSHIVEYCPALCDSVPEAKSAFLDPALGERLEALCRKMSGAPSFSDTPVNGVAYLNADGTVEALPEGDMFAYLAAKYPGKVLYIDIYATWCGPCRTEMKEAPALHKVMHGRDVVFVNLCLGSDKEAWLKTVAQMNLEGENYWFDADATQLFLGAYSLTGYPTYILVGRDGKIATMKAGRPSALTQTATQIDGLL